MAIQLLIILAFQCIHIGLTLARPLTIPRDGEINDPGGFSGLSYHSKRWEPLCASITQVFDTFDMSNFCIEALDRYTNDTSRTMGLYERGGTRLEGAIIGGGRDLCMCFSVSTIAGLGNDMCFYFGPTAILDLWWQLQIDYRIASSVRSGSAKALPHCADVDITSLEASWSATAVQPSATGSVSNIGPTTTTTTATLTPTVASLTMTSTKIYTNSQGQTVTEPIVFVTQAPVIVVQQSGGLTRQEKIGLGVGLGIGLLSLIIALTGLL